jgi:hypothetical protein
MLQKSRENHDHLNGHSQQFPTISQNIDLRRKALQQRIGSSGFQSPHRQSIPSYVLEVERFYQQHILNGKSSAANFRHQRNQENC